jgi:hypothetical protein
MPGTNIGSHRSIKMPDDLLARWGVPATAPLIVQEALVYWESKCAGRRMPARRDLDPVFEIPSLLPWVMLVDVLRQPLDFRYRLIGTGIAARARHDHTGCRFSDLSRAGSDSVVWKDRMAVVQTRAPKLTTPPYIGRDNRIQGVCGIHLPLSSDGEAVDMILTAVAYRMPG